MNYGDWRDNINPDLLYRYWQKLGKPGMFIRHTPYGFSLYEYPTPFGDLTVMNTKFAEYYKLHGVKIKTGIDWRTSGG